MHPPSEAITKPQETNDELTLGIESYCTLRLGSGMIAKPTLFAEQTRFPNATGSALEQSEVGLGLRLKLETPRSRDKTSSAVTFALDRREYWRSSRGTGPEDTKLSLQFTRRF